MTDNLKQQSPGTASLSPAKMTIDQAKELANRHLKQGQLKEALAVIKLLQQALPLDAEVDLLTAAGEFQNGHPSIARGYALKARHNAPNLAKVDAVLAQFEALDRTLGADNYRNSFLMWRNLHMDFPMNIQLETTGHCNATCDFCPHSGLERKSTTMSDELFEKIVNEASAVPPGKPLNFFMNVVNEPFMDKNIFPRMLLLNKKIPHATIGIYTNMNVLPPHFFENLAEIQQITYWNISFNAANKKEYEHSMGLNFERTVANIRRFISENRKQKFVKGEVYLSRIGTGGDADARFVEECKSLFIENIFNEDYFPVCKNRADWLGQVRVEGRSKVPALMPCHQWLNFSIHCNGLVPLCCMDAKGEFPFGDVTKQSIQEIYNSPRFRNLRENVISRDVIYPCNTCALM